MDIFEENPRMPLKILLATTVGLGAVSTFSTWAGYAIAPGSAEQNTVFFGILSIFFAAFPYFLLRELVLEARAMPSKAAIQIIHLVSIFFLACSALAARQGFGQIVMHYIPLAVSIATFAYLYLRLAYAAHNHIGDESRVFTKRVLIPSLFACIIPFLYGWSIAFAVESLPVITFTFSILVFWDMKLSKGKFRRNLGFLVFLILISVVLTYFDQNFKALTFGCLMTLAMGAAEVAKRVHLTVTRKIPIHPNESDAYYMKGANWSFIVFPLGLLALPFLISDFPSWAACAAAFVQIASWSFFSEAAKKRRLAYYLAIFGGFCVPFLVVIGTKYSSFQSLLKVDINQEISLITGFFLAFSAVFLNRVKRALYRAGGVGNLFLNEKICAFLSLMFILFYLFAISLMCSLLSKFSLNSTYLFKGADVYIFLLILAALFGIKYFLISSAPPADKEGGGKFKEDILGNKNVEVERVGMEKNFGLTAWMRHFNLVLITARWPVCLISGAPITLGLYVCNASWANILALTVCMMLSTASAFLVNDFFDYQKDKLAEIQRPVSSGALSRYTSLYYGGISSGLSLVFAALTGSTSIIFAAIVINFGVCLYSLISRHAPLLKGIVTAALCTSPFIFIAIIADREWLTAPIALLFFFVWARELVMDAIDLDGDLMSGIRTLAAFLGTKQAYTIGWAIMLASVVTLFFFIQGNARYVSMVCILTLIVAFFTFLKNKDNGILISRSSMLLGSLAMALNANL